MGAGVLPPVLIPVAICSVTDPSSLSTAVMVRINVTCWFPVVVTDCEVEPLPQLLWGVVRDRNQHDLGSWIGLGALRGEGGFVRRSADR